MAVVADDDHEQQVKPPEKKKPQTEDEKRRKKIVPGSLMKAVVRPGGGESKPAEGNQVIYHCTVRTLDGVTVESTRSEFGGKGTPIRHVVGKSKVILGLLEGIPTMLKGEVAVFKMKPEMHYGEKDCPVAVPDNFPKDSELHFEIELIEFSKVKVITDDLGVLKKVIEEGQSWETPREPYEVKAWISAKSGDGKVILPRTQDEPYFFTFGKSEVPKGLELGISTMPRGEKAVIYVKSQYYTESTLMPVVEGVDEVHFEVELVHFIQVRDVLGDGRLIKRRIRDGRGEFPMACPLQDSLLRVHYKGFLLNEEKTVFYDTQIDNNGQPLEFSSGEGLDWTGFSFREIMDDVEKIKGTGNRLFKEGKFELAKAKYDKASVLREFNHLHPQDDEEGKEFANTRVLDANPVHVKALYRRGMAYMASGDFEEARADFIKMMSVDKLSEASAKAALLKLKKEEQEVERKVRKQFKGLFDKRPGEIAEVGTNDGGDDEVTGEKLEKDDLDSLDDHEEGTHQTTAPPPRQGILSQLRKLFASLRSELRRAVTQSLIPPPHHLSSKGSVVPSAALVIKALKEPERDRKKMTPI
ncbi:hypothetical protein RND71_009246 [Anisodus tanguticus]|uniref:peptidylprolyl isomerase n=1 Tax=Anisodus tanguticus TaxID=243964 RepID=A0AAE1SJ88_9SOLA|nr:hypothetical protein RND71_009246 [Anisodus tanguticus]